MVPTAPWVPGDTAVFAAGVDAVGFYAVTVPAFTVIPGVDGITFEEGSPFIAPGGAGAALTLTDPTITTFAGTAPTLTVDIGGIVGLTKAGPGELDLVFPKTYAGGTTVNGGVLFVADNTTMGAAAGGITLNGGTLRTAGAAGPYARDVLVGALDGTIDSSGVNPNFTGTLGGPGTLTKVGVGTLSVQHVRTSALTITAGAVRVAPGPTAGTFARTSNVTALALAGGAAPTVTLNITNNGLVVNYAGASPLPLHVAQITSAYAGGAWTGPGITSTSAGGTYGIGYAESSDVFFAFPAAFLGQAVDATSVLMRLTRYGDANLDGVVNLNDFNRLAGNFGRAGVGWPQGDFDYNGVVNLNDFNRLAGNFGLIAGPDGPTADDWAALASAVPEPAAGGLLCLCLSIVVCRRRRAALRNSAVHVVAAVSVRGWSGPNLFKRS
jgi:autotransporter-associated beta strand protein